MSTKRITFKKGVIKAVNIDISSLVEGRKLLKTGTKVVVEGRVKIVEDADIINAYSPHKKRMTHKPGEVDFEDRLTRLMRCEVMLINPSNIDIAQSDFSGLYPIWCLIELLQTFRNTLLEKYSSSLTEPHASLAAGVLLGGDVQMPKAFHQQLITTGMLHVVAASGYNINIIVAVAISFLKRIFSKRTALIVSLCGIFGYAVLAGFSPSIVRAAIMGVFGVLSQLKGRVYYPLWALVLTVECMLLWSPLLIRDASFQLSVAATLGMFIFLPTVQKSKAIEGEDKGIVAVIRASTVEAFLTTLSASVFTLPIILYRFGRLSLIGLVSNVALLWLVPIIMLLSAVFVFFSLFTPFAGFLFAVPLWVVTHIFIIGIRFFSNVPFASIEFSSVSIVLVFIWYLLLFFFWWMRKKPAYG